MRNQTITEEYEIRHTFIFVGEIRLRNGIFTNKITGTNACPNETYNIFNREALFRDYMYRFLPRQVEVYEERYPDVALESISLSEVRPGKEANQNIIMLNPDLKVTSRGARSTAWDMRSMRTFVEMYIQEYQQKEYEDRQAKELSEQALAYKQIDASFAKLVHFSPDDWVYFANYIQNFQKVPELLEQVKQSAFRQARKEIENDGFWMTQSGEARELEIQSRVGKLLLAQVLLKKE